MGELHPGQQEGKKRHSLVIYVILTAVVISLIGGAAPTARSAAVKAQPILLQMASQNPQNRLNVIVQKSAQDGSVEAAIARLGGKVTKDLHIINAIGAQIVAGSVQELAAMDSIRWISFDSPVEQSAGSAIDTSNLQNVYTRVVKAPNVWNTAPNYWQGQGIGVAVVDSGVSNHQDLRTGYQSRIIDQVEYTPGSNSYTDSYGHGTHVAGIIAGNGAASNGAFIGIAPRANIINVKVSDDHGLSYASDVVSALQWVQDNKDRQHNGVSNNIKVVNLSFNQSMPEPYLVNPIDAACEILWFNGIVVVVSAGNAGPNLLLPPANDPFVITVGAADDKGTVSMTDDTVASFSSYGVSDGLVLKPDLIAPGVHIKAPLASMDAQLAQDHPTAVVPGYQNKYFQMSGTSMAAPVVAGTVALMLNAMPNLTPDQVKYRLKTSANHNLLTFPGYNPLSAGAGYLNIQEAVQGNYPLRSANTGTIASALLWTGGDPVSWGTTTWNSVNWNSVNWNSVNWNSVNWNSVNWTSDWWTP